MTGDELEKADQHAILAGLRLLQNFLNNERPDEEAINGILEESGNPLSAEDVDELCERINTSDIFLR